MARNSPSPRPNGRGHPRMVSLICPAATHKLRALKPERDSATALIHNRRADCLFMLCPKTCAPLCTGKFPTLPALLGKGAQAAGPKSLGLLGPLDFRVCLQSQEGKSDRRDACCIGGTRISSPYVSTMRIFQIDCSDIQHSSPLGIQQERCMPKAGGQKHSCKILWCSW